RAAFQRPARAAAAGADAGDVAPLVFPGRRMRGGHDEWMVRLDDRKGVDAVLGKRVELDRDAVELLRIHAAIPAVPVDVGPGDLPGEAGLEADAISYTKGCYLGQEVMARLRSMGQVRRRLLRVRGPAGDVPPALPAQLFAGGRSVGELRSIARDAEGFIGWAMLTLMHVPAGARLGFAVDAPPTVVLVDSP
ncbi:MAG: tRNA-modifying protein YgfZ, partial [Opitutus sp.]